MLSKSWGADQNGFATLVSSLQGALCNNLPRNAWLLRSACHAGCHITVILKPPMVLHLLKFELRCGFGSTSKISVMWVSGGFGKHFSLCVPFGMLVHVHRILYWVEQALGLCYALRVDKSSALNTSLTTVCQHHCLVPLEAGCLPILSNSLLSIDGYTHTLCSGLVS